MISIGNRVNLTVCRGYPLVIDPNDPNIEIMSLAAINKPSFNTDSPLKKVNDDNNSYDDYFCEEYDEIFAGIVKGNKGFGFTIADDSHQRHQRVKQILDRERCINLIENDILLEINGVGLRDLSHNQVVDILKECLPGQEIIIKLKRRKYEIQLPASSLQKGNFYYLFKLI
jgi:atrophin-1 interacting protein 3 (BAI1-associated protein 1)